MRGGVFTLILRALYLCCSCCCLWGLHFKSGRCSLKHFGCLERTGSFFSFVCEHHLCFLLGRGLSLLGAGWPSPSRGACEPPPEGGWVLLRPLVFLPASWCAVWDARLLLWQIAACFLNFLICSRSNSSFLLVYCWGLLLPPLTWHGGPAPGPWEP